MELYNRVLSRIVPSWPPRAGAGSRGPGVSSTFRVQTSPERRGEYEPERRARGRDFRMSRITGRGDARLPVSRVPFYIV